MPFGTKPIKTLAKKNYNKWLQEKIINQETPVESLKLSLRCVIVNWIMEAW